VSINEVATKGKTDKVACRGRTVRSGIRGRTEDSILILGLYTIQVSDSGKSGSLWNIPERESFWNLPKCLFGQKGACGEIDTKAEGL
jgi:hypothetical protein